MKDKTNILTIILCGLVVVLLSVMFFVIPDKQISQKENRGLSQVPQFNTDSVLSGKYTQDLSEYISDQFPARDTFVAAKAYSEKLQNKGENNGVIFADNGTLIARDEITDNRLQENLDSVKTFSGITSANITVALLPRTIDVFSENLPSSYPKETDQLLWQNFFEYSKQINLSAPNLYDTLCEENNYYHTDHHYNTYGAYSAYKLLGESLNYTPKEKDFFDLQTVSNSFCGTSMRKSGFYFADKDEITLFRYDGDIEYNIVADGKNIAMYDMAKLDTTDQYAVFLGGNHARLDITISGENREKLLIIRDSFADSLAPFLAMHYDLVMIDLRYFDDNVGQIVKDENITRVLIFESISEFATTKNLSYLRRPVND